MRKLILILGMLLVVASSIPLFLIGWESFTNHQIDKEYNIENIMNAENSNFSKVPGNFEFNGQNIVIKEEATEKKAPLTEWDQDSNVLAGDIVKIHISLNGKEITQPDEVWLSNRERGGRYYSWLNIVKVNNQIAVIERLNEDDNKQNLRWKIIWIDTEGTVNEQILNSESLTNDPLSVKLINISNTGIGNIGYHTNINSVYPTIIFPFLYPYLTIIIGFIIILFSLLRRKKGLNTSQT